MRAGAMTLSPAAAYQREREERHLEDALTGINVSNRGRAISATREHSEQVAVEGHLTVTVDPG